VVAQDGIFVGEVGWGRYLYRSPFASAFK